MPLSTGGSLRAPSSLTSEPSNASRSVTPSHTLSSIGVPLNQDDLHADTQQHQWTYAHDHRGSSNQTQCSSLALGQFNNTLPPRVAPPAASYRYNNAQSDSRQNNDRGRSPSNDRTQDNRERFDRNPRSRNKDDHDEPYAPRRDSHDGHYGPKRDQHNPYNSRERDRSRSSERPTNSASNMPLPPALKLPITPAASTLDKASDDQSSVDIITSPDGQFVTAIETFGRDGILIASTPMLPPLHKSCFNPAMFPSIRNKSLMMHRSYVSRIDFESLAIWDTGCCGTSVSSSIQNVAGLRTTTSGEVVTESATGQQVVFPQVGTLLASPIAISPDIKSPTLLNMVGIARDGGIAYLADQHGLIAVASETFTHLLSLLRPSDILYHTQTLDGLYTIDLNHADAHKLVNHTAAFAASAPTSSKKSVTNWPHCFTQLDPCIKLQLPIAITSIRHSSRQTSSLAIRHSSRAYMLRQSPFDTSITPSCPSPVTSLISTDNAMPDDTIKKACIYSNTYHVECEKTRKKKISLGRNPDVADNDHAEIQEYAYRLAYHGGALPHVATPIAPIPHVVLLPRTTLLQDLTQDSNPIISVTTYDEVLDYTITREQQPNPPVLIHRDDTLQSSQRPTRVHLTRPNPFNFDGTRPLRHASSWYFLEGMIPTEDAIFKFTRCEAN